MGKGHLVVHGGGSTGKDATGTFLKRAGSPSAPIVVLGQVSEAAVEKGQRSADWLKENGATDVYVARVTETDKSSLPELLTRLESARGYWVPGGDQNRFMKLFAGTAVPDALRKIIARGGSGGGSSAGASLCGEWMPTGYSGIRPTEDEDRTKLVKNSVGSGPGISVLPGFLVDTHFLARERTQRSVDMVLSHPRFIALGVEQDGWFVADLDKGVLTVGAGQVVTIRAAAPVQTDAQNRLGCTDVRMRVLLAGQTVSLAELKNK
ncbi:MAG: Type 1 glutamine amidotransferase-like domain-containing protein [Akkermansiaceae bacterium]|nr:Type 1 glutamine amidotransferase-like domain-containing protein [Armatimonadota bacterium]